MILVSVGTQLPFDRMIRTVDQWAAEHNVTDIFGQIGPSSYSPIAMNCVDFLAPDDFHALQKQCKLMISHAGMGSIITAMQLGKPIIIMARDHRRHEHRNGHQFSTLKQFQNVPGVYPCTTPEELIALLNRADELRATPSLNGSAPADMIERLINHVDRIPTPEKPSLLRRLLVKSR